MSEKIRSRDRRRLQSFKIKYYVISAVKAIVILPEDLDEVSFNGEKFKKKR